MSQKAIKITGWTMTIVLALVFTMSAFLKLTQNETALAQASSFGIDATKYQFIGIIEIISLILFIVPRTGILGTMLLVAYLGGAIVTHLQHQQPIAMAVIFQILLWVTAFIRFPELKQRIFSTKKIQQL
ncbi:MAG: DoxX family protein [Weeksellaceae bacterium]|nr:DoxX family protein [Weeksellaceae bacterium]